MVVGIDAALERSGVSGPIKEPRLDTQGSNPIASFPSSADAIGLANHVVGRDMTCALAKPDENFEGANTSDPSFNPLTLLSKNLAGYRS
jgi:hypothetical protein